MAGEFTFFNPDVLRSIVNALNAGKTWAQATAPAAGWNLDADWLATQETPGEAPARKEHAASAQGEGYQAALWRAAADPAITSLEPVTGAAAGGERVVIYGSGFAPGCIVTFDAQETEVVVVDPDHALVATPAHAAGAVDVVLTNPNENTDTASAAFTYS